MNTNYIKVYDKTHATHKYGIECINEENGEYLDTIDIFWFPNEHERDKEFKGLIFDIGANNDK
jgi:hypothetical protein